MDLSLPAIINAALASEGSWSAVICHFCHIVIEQKKDYERVRQGEDGRARGKG